MVVGGSVCRMGCGFGAMLHCSAEPLRDLCSDSSREGGGSTKKAMKDAIFSLEGRSALGGSTAFQATRRGCMCAVVSTQWPRHDKRPSG